MVRKRVWLGIFLMLVVIICTEKVYGANLGFKVSNHYCQDYLIQSYEGSDEGFRAEFFGKFTGTGFTSGTPIPTKQSATEILFSGSYDRTGNVACMGPNLDENDRAGIFAYGYVYTLDKLFSTTFMVGSHIDQRENWYSSGRFFFMNLDDYTTGTTDLKNYIAGKDTSKYCTFKTVLDDNSLDAGSRSTSWSYASSACEHTSEVPAGLHFIGIGLVGHSTGRVAETVSLGSSIGIADFNTEGDTAMYIGSLDRSDATGGKPRYVISDAPLTASELNTYFGSHVENTSWLCKAAGGQLFTDKFSTFKYNSNNGLLEFNGVNANFDTSHLCCGDDADEFYAFNHTDGITKTYLCSGGVWQDAASLETKCNELVDAKGYTAKGNVYNQLLNVNNWGIWQIGLAYDPYMTGADGCCGDDMSADYGYINSLKNFMCYDTKRDRADPLFNWTNAALDKYYIKTVTNSAGKDVDVISNSNKWFYCDATGTGGLNGVPIGNGGTFTGATQPNQYSCADMLSVLLSHDIAEDCPNANPSYCCMKFSGNVQYRPNVESCQYCYNESPRALNSDDFKNMIPKPNPTVSLSSGGALVDKELCVLDPGSCLVGSFRYTPTENCNAQPTTFKNSLCNDETSYCVKGWKLPTLDSTAGNLCCYGPEAQCKPITTLNNEKDCADFGGINYVPGRYSCSYSVSYGTAPNIKHCCIGNLSINYSFSQTFSIANTSFMCFKEDNNNIISQCCFDSKCRNTAYSLTNNAEDLNMFDRRVLTKGSSLHTLENFDWINRSVAANSLIKDNAGKYPVGVGEPMVYYLPTSTWDLNLNSFSYVEFDMLTDSTNMSLMISDRNLGNLSQFMVGGSKERVWHHIIIPLNHVRLQGITNVSPMIFYHDEAVPRTIILDNIMLTAEGEKLAYSTKNYYCTGGFSGWIDDLDAPAGSSTFDQKGPYMFACSGIATFGWTGNNCCGDDTKVINYGEFFNDSEAGCFNGTKVENNKRVSDVKGIYESAVFEKDKLRTYEYSDLLYINNTFIGCQVPTGKYDSLKKSINAGTPGSTAASILADNVLTQCTVKGDYYCMNGVWRKRVLTNYNCDPGQEFPANANITLKMAISGPDLIKSGFKAGQNYVVPARLPLPTEPTWLCNGYDKSDTVNVCGGHGTCTYAENCVCDTGYSGKYCGVSGST